MNTIIIASFNLKQQQKKIIYNMKDVDDGERNRLLSFFLFCCIFSRRSIIEKVGVSRGTNHKSDTETILVQTQYPTRLKTTGNRKALQWQPCNSKKFEQKYLDDIKQARG